jgi:putative xylitol transport system permease protein
MPPNEPTTKPAASGSAGRKSALGWLTQYGIIIAFLLLCVALTFLNKYFLTPENISNILLQTSINGILAMGMTLVILTGGIDLSVGSVLAFSSIVAATFVTGDNAQSPLVALIVGVATGAVLGLINGCIVAYLKIPPFVATLGMLSVAWGLTYAYTGGMPVPNLSESFLNLGEGSLLGVPVPVLIFAILWIVLNHTSYGRSVYAVGGNVKSARTAGIATNPVTASVYVGSPSTKLSEAKNDDSS